MFPILGRHIFGTTNRVALEAYPQISEVQCQEGLCGAIKVQTSCFQSFLKLNKMKNEPMVEMGTWSIIGSPLGKMSTSNDRVWRGFQRNLGCSSCSYNVAHVRRNIVRAM